MTVSGSRGVFGRPRFEPTQVAADRSTLGCAHVVVGRRERDKGAAERRPRILCAGEEAQKVARPGAPVYDGAEAPSPEKPLSGRGSAVSSEACFGPPKGDEARPGGAVPAGGIPCSGLELAISAHNDRSTIANVWGWIATGRRYSKKDRGLESDAAVYQ
jgi:hypothetical protein